MNEALKLLAEHGISSSQEAWEILIQGAATVANFNGMVVLAGLGLIVGIWSASASVFFSSSNSTLREGMLIAAIIVSVIGLGMILSSLSSWYYPAYDPEYWALQKVLDKLGN